MTTEVLESVTETVEDFAQGSDIRMEYLPMHENPYRHSNNQQSAYHYSCKLINAEEKWFVVYFSKGAALRLWVSPPEEFESSGKPLHVPLVNVGCHYDGPLPPFEDEYNRMIFDKCSIPAPPSVAEVLDCLANDSYTMEMAITFERWCLLMKANEDSVHVRRLYEVCCQHRLKLQASLGPEQYHRLVHEMGRTIENGEEHDSHN